jgi:hypothetical protein
MDFLLHHSAAAVKKVDVKTHDHAALQIFDVMPRVSGASSTPCRCGWHGAPTVDARDYWIARFRGQ